MVDRQYHYGNLGKFKIEFRPQQRRRGMKGKHYKSGSGEQTDLNQRDVVCKEDPSAGKSIISELGMQKSSLG